MDDDSAGVALFGRRAASKSTPPPFDLEARDELAALEIGEAEAGDSGESRPTTGGTTAAVSRSTRADAQAQVVKRWYKRLSATDAQQLDRRTAQGAGAATLIQAGHPIDRATYFRHDLFGDATWIADEAARETAVIDFEVSIDGVDWGCASSSS